MGSKAHIKSFFCRREAAAGHIFTFTGQKRLKNDHFGEPKAALCGKQTLDSIEDSYPGWDQEAEYPAMDLREQPLNPTNQGTTECI